MPSLSSIYTESATNIARHTLQILQCRVLLVDYSLDDVFKLQPARKDRLCINYLHRSFAVISTSVVDGPQTLQAVAA